MTFRDFLKFWPGTVDNLMKQIEPFQPGFTLGERAKHR